MARPARRDPFLLPTRPPVRLLWLFLGLAVLFLIPFLIWGAGIEQAFSLDGAVTWLRGHGEWAWAAGIALLFSDLLIPVPGTAVMSALGFVYGTLYGGLIGAAGSFAAGSAAYWLCRLVGRGAAQKLLGADDLARGERLFREVGGWLVVASRVFPILPEVVACMAGLTRMPAPVFHAALACGSLPLAFVFAYVGAVGQGAPLVALSLSAAVPLVLWLAARSLMPRGHGPAEEETTAPERHAGS